MCATFLKQLKPAALMLLWLSLVTGLAYPLAVTGLAGVLFPVQAGGSLIAGPDGPIGSALIGQPFSSDRYFWSRPSATSPRPYDASASSGSNLGPTNPELAKAVAERASGFSAMHGVHYSPMDMVTASGSGLDPHISPAAAVFQVHRVAKARGISSQAVAALVAAHTEAPLWGFWGEARVNVLALNLALDSAVRKE